MGNTTLKIVLDRLTEEIGDDFGSRIFDKGEIRRFINIYINGEDIRFLNVINRVKNNDEISILPAVSGGEIIII